MADCPGEYPAPGQNVLGGIWRGMGGGGANLLTTASTLILSLELGLATYY